MQKQNKQKISYSNLKIMSLLMMIAATSFLLARKGFADNSITQISQNSDTQQQIQDLQKKAAIYRQIIDLKKQQSSSLSDQLQVTNNNIQNVQSQINSTKQQINDYNTQIVRLDNDIQDKENTIALQKKLLISMMESYYEADQRNLLDAYLSNNNFKEFLTGRDQLMQTGDKITDMANSVESLKKSLSDQRAQLDDKKTDVVTMNQNLQDQSDNLQNVKDQRQALLTQTQGEEEKYKQLLAKVEEEKQQLLDIDQYFASSGLSIDSYPKPDSKYFASTSWYYSQRDPKWGDENIGNTKTLMKSYGCAVTAVAMVFKEHGGSMDPGDLANAPIFSGDLINWPSSWSKPSVKLTSNGYGHGNISWSVIDAQIAKGNPVIVYIAKSNGKGGHYVVIHHKTSDGQYVVHDPYLGPNIFLNTSRALVGAMGADSATSINQMIIYN